MGKHEADEAFEWLVVIFGVLAAILVQYPEYFYTASPGKAPAGLVAAIFIIPPIVLSVVIWLVGKLSERHFIQVLAKVAAWALILSATWLCLWMYFLGVMSAAWGFAPAALTTGLGPLLFVVLSPAITCLVVAPKYRRMHPDIRLLRSIWGLLSVCLVIQAFMGMWVAVTRSVQF